MNPWTAAALVPVALIALGVIWALDGSDGSDWAAFTVLAIGGIAIAAVAMVITPVGAALVSWGLFALWIGKVLGTWVDKKNKAANARRLELQSRRREREKQQRLVDFGAEGARL